MGHQGYLDITHNQSMQSILLEDTDLVVPPSTKLACTIGPQSRTVEVLTSLLEAGMTIARFDFSFGKADWHQVALDNLRIAGQNTQRLCAVMIDTAGPEIFVLNRPAEPILLEAGHVLVVTCDHTQKASSKMLPISYPTLAGTTMQAGSSVFVGTYLFTGSETSSAYLTVQSVQGDSAVCVCNNTCTLEGLQLTVQIGSMKNEAPALTQDDQRIISTFAKLNHVDFIALSFCRNAQDVRDCRAFLSRHDMPQVQVVAKLENKEGLVHYREILEEADAIVLSRGNLGVCLDAEKMFLAQKMLLRECNLAGKPIYVTRVVDTMVEAPRPTRAEATDVANLVLDGADGILLGSETFRGKFPELTVRTVRAIAKQAESCYNSYAYYKFAMKEMGIDRACPNMEKTEALATAAVRAATKLRAALIVVFTVTGRTARLIAKYRPSQPILTVVVPRLTTDGLAWHYTGDFQARQCLQYRGVLPICADPTIGSPDGAILNAAFAYARGKGLIKSGDRVVVSQCPRTAEQDNMAERGVVKIITVDGDNEPMPVRYMSKHGMSAVIGSYATLTNLIALS